jgi:hypothetical protein
VKASSLVAAMLIAAGAVPALAQIRVDVRAEGFLQPLNIEQFGGSFPTNQTLVLDVSQLATTAGATADPYTLTVWVYEAALLADPAPAPVAVIPNIQIIQSDPNVPAPVRIDLLLSSPQLTGSTLAVC